MSKKIFTDRLENESNNIELPEKLKKENILNLIETKSQIKIVKSEKDNSRQTKRRIASGIVSVAAAVAIIFGIVNIPDSSVIKKSNYGADNENEYEQIEKNITDYYMRNYYTESHWYDNFSYILKSQKVSDTSDTAGVGETTDESEQVDLYGKTNIQVEGVDEADIVKNDGNYIYVVNENKLYITDKKLNVLSDMTLYEDTDNSWVDDVRIFVRDNRLVAVYNISEYFDDDKYYGKTSSYCCDCCYVSLRNKTQVKVFDIEDRTNPKCIYEYGVDGYGISSRMFDGKILVVANYNVPYNSISGDDEDDLCTALSCVSVPIETINGEENRIDINDISVISDVSPMNYVVSIMFSLDDPKNTEETTAVLGTGDEIYCSGDYMFVAGSEYSYWSYAGGKVLTYDNTDYISGTTIYMYSVSGNKPEYICKQSVAGVGIGQFSMDYYDGYFRMGVTVGYDGSDLDYNNANRIYVFDKNLNIVGESGDFGKGEILKSIRFIENIAYAVTFEQTDPLFVIDLSVPEKPVISGEVMLPGYSEYMHPVGSNMIIGVGYGGTEDGVDGSAKISLFDVEDMKNPKELYSYTVKDSYFVTDSRAFAVLGENLYGLIYVNYDNNNTENINFVVFGIKDNRLDVKYTQSLGGFELENNRIYVGNCRLTYIGDVLYCIKGNCIYSLDLQSGKILKSVEL